MTKRSPIRCEEVVKHLLTYLDGEISREKRLEIQHHLEECHECCSRAEFERALRRKVADLGEEKTSPELRDRVRALIAKF